MICLFSRKWKRTAKGSEQKQFTDSLDIYMKHFQQLWYQKDTQEEKERQQIKETYHNNQHKILIEKL